MLSHDYNWKEKKKKKKERKQDGLKLKEFWPVAEQYNREAGLSVCFDLPFIGSAGGSQIWIHSFIRSLACLLIN